MTSEAYVKRHHPDARAVSYLEGGRCRWSIIIGSLGDHRRLGVAGNRVSWAWADAAERIRTARRKAKGATK